MWGESRCWNFFILCVLQYYLPLRKYLHRLLISHLSLLFARPLWGWLCGSPEGIGNIFLIHHATLMCQWSLMLSYFPRVLTWTHQKLFHWLPGLCWGLQEFAFATSAQIYYAAIPSAAPWSLQVSTCGGGMERSRFWCFPALLGNWDLDLVSSWLTPLILGFFSFIMDG